MITMRALYLDLTRLSQEQCDLIADRLDRLMKDFPGLDIDSDCDLVDCQRCGTKADRYQRGEPLCDLCIRTEKEATNGNS